MVTKEYRMRVIGAPFLSNAFVEYFLHVKRRLMKLRHSAILTVSTVTMLLVASSTIALAETGSQLESNSTATTNRAAMKAQRQQTNLTRLSLNLTNNINSAIHNLTIRDTNLKKRVANQQAKGWPVSTEAQTAIAELETQINVLRGMVPVQATTLDSLKTTRQQFWAARKAGVEAANKANRSLLSNRKTSKTTTSK